VLHAGGKSETAYNCRLHRSAATSSSSSATAAEIAVTKETAVDYRRRSVTSGYICGSSSSCWRRPKDQSPSPKWPGAGVGLLRRGSQPTLCPFHQLGGLGGVLYLPSKVRGYGSPAAKKSSCILDAPGTCWGPSSETWRPFKSAYEWLHLPLIDFHLTLLSLHRQSFPSLLVSLHPFSPNLICCFVIHETSRL